jgi:integrase/recombinase XerD
MPTKERVSGLCRVDCARGESKGLRNGPKNLITRASIGIIRQSALCRLCRARHKRHTFACRRLLGWYGDGTQIDRAIDRLSAYPGHVKVTDTYRYLTGVPELLSLAGRRFEQFAVPFQGDAP